MLMWKTKTFLDHLTTLNISKEGFIQAPFYARAQEAMDSFSKLVLPQIRCTFLPFKHCPDKCLLRSLLNGETLSAMVFISVPGAYIQMLQVFPPHFQSSNTCQICKALLKITIFGSSKHLVSFPGVPKPEQLQGIDLDKHISLWQDGNMFSMA